MPVRSAKPQVRALAWIAVALGMVLLGTSCRKSNACPQTFADFPASTKSGLSAECMCSAAATSGAVWGNAIYTTDSSVCAAALHAGAATPSGGPVTVKMAAGCPSYQGGPRNGIISSTWGPFGSSFYFAGHGDGKCAGAGPSDPCPEDFARIPSAATVTDFACACPATTGVASRSIYGNGIYTTDASICAPCTPARSRAAAAR